MCIDFCVFLVKSIMRKYLLISLGVGVVLFLWSEFIPVGSDLAFFLMILLMNPLLLVLPLLNISLDSGVGLFFCLLVNLGILGALIGFLKDRGLLDLRTKLFMAFILLLSLYWIIGSALGRSA